MSVGGLQPISHTELGDEVSGLRRIDFELVSQLLDVDAQVVGVVLMRRSPHLPQKLLVRDYHAHVTRQRRYEPKLERSEANLDAFARHVACFEIDGCAL